MKQGVDLAQKSFASNIPETDVVAFLKKKMTEEEVNEVLRRIGKK